jgi:FKBP-type peptidyl-prolyl cis-trans isomerase FkpA
MNRYLKAFSLFSLIALFAACKKDDSVTVAPPRDYGVQYAAEKDSIENYLKTHYIESVDEDMNIQLLPIPDGGDQVSIWDQDAYPLQNKIVNSNDVDYTVYYLVLREGVGETPTRGDDVMVAYRGTLLDGTQFDYTPFPDALSPLPLFIEGWHNIIPLFKTGVYVDIPNSPDPPSYQDFGAGVMFLPSGLAYFNTTPSSIVSAYDSMIFSFKLYDLEYTDLDADGILNKDETVAGTDIKDYDTDGDETPNYLDTDDDGDGYTTLREITDPETDEVYEVIPACSGGTVLKHLDPACH